MDAKSICKEALKALEDLKAVNPIVIDVRPLTDVTDFLIICSGTSNRHVKSLADNVSVELKKRDIRPVGVEGEDAGEWVLVDYGDVVIHVMLPTTRDFYDLERLWADPDPDHDSGSRPGPDSDPNTKA
jgi:ribosome-associated protein